MGITRTGNAEIDQQHEILDSMVAQLAGFCVEGKRDSELTCQKCSLERLRSCTATLDSISDQLGAFLIGHATYEERMMELLPQTPTCQAHVKAHKAAHAGVARQLKKLAMKIATQPPRQASNDMWQVIGDWLGDHTALFDSRMVRLGKSAAPEIDFDGELVNMLDQHVFPNRPMRRKTVPAAPDPTLNKKRIEVRGRFESLSPAQREVFWHVLGGKKNSEIATTLGVSINTVKTHRAAVFQKMDVTSVVELVKMTGVLR
ncbi:MAG: hypothetical protein EG825_09730 [Rhodocyclaceae bacterium]|nr:hypothetical protein [Rhodocyclaceae bacterium]